MLGAGYAPIIATQIEEPCVPIFGSVRCEYRTMMPRACPVIEVDMDDRQTKIREGAGLEDSRVNQEFIDFLNKWSTPFCILLLVAAGVYWGLNYLEQQRVARVDQAFSEYEAVVSGGNPSPNSLKTIADENEGTMSISELARLREVDLYLGAYALGLAPGAQIDPVTKTVANEGDILDQDDRDQYLALAESTAKKVLDSTKGDDDKAIFTMQALSRLASVEESKQDFDAAKSYYEQLGSLAEAQRFSSLKAYADKRIEDLGTLGSFGELPTNEQIPSLGSSAELPLIPTDPIETDADEDLAPERDEAPAADPSSDETSQDTP